jgi:hypothetical protein
MLIGLGYGGLGLRLSVIIFLAIVFVLLSVGSWVLFWLWLGLVAVLLAIVLGYSGRVCVFRLLWLGVRLVAAIVFTVVCFGFLLVSRLGLRVGLV